MTECRGRTYHCGKGFTDSANNERHPWGEFRVAFLRKEDDTLHSLEDAVRDCRVNGENESWLDTKPQTGDAFFFDDFACDSKERIVSLAIDHGFSRNIIPELRWSSDLLPSSNH